MDNFEIPPNLTPRPNKSSHLRLLNPGCNPRAPRPLQDGGRGENGIGTLENMANFGLHAHGHAAGNTHDGGIRGSETGYLGHLQYPVGCLEAR